MESSIEVDVKLWFYIINNTKCIERNIATTIISPTYHFHSIFFLTLRVRYASAINRIAGAESTYTYSSLTIETATRIQTAACIKNSNLATMLPISFLTEESQL